MTDDPLFGTLAAVCRALRGLGQHAAAFWIWRNLEHSFPEAWEPIYESAQALWELGRPEEALGLLRAGAARFPTYASLFRTAEAEIEDHMVRAANCNLAMQFESLGGAGHGCEFGLFQRHFGAEPLGLLRWADLSADLLALALEDRFEGVGEPEHTIVFVPDGDEYWTRDARYWMAMRSFIKIEDVSPDQMARKIRQRQKILTRKLISDLEENTKIFVFKDMRRVLPADILDRLHAAVRSYGDSTLLYVRFSDASHPNGTVVVDRPGLMIGYIDHFAFSPEDHQLDFPYDSWLALCKRAAALRV